MAQNPNRLAPSEHPNPTTKIGSKMGGAPTPNGTIGFDPQPCVWSPPFVSFFIMISSWETHFPSSWSLNFLGRPFACEFFPAKSQRGTRVLKECYNECKIWWIPFGLQLGLPNLAITLQGHVSQDNIIYTTQRHTLPRPPI